MQKRPSQQDGSDDGDALSPMKRSRLGGSNSGSNSSSGSGETALTVVPSTSSALVTTGGAGNKTGETGTRRTSSLQAPIMLLSGHTGAVFSIDFDPSGQHLVSGSFDRQIFLWNVYGECSNYNVLSGHKNAVLQVKWSPGANTNYIASCSADKTVCVWDANKGSRVRKYAEHTGIVNACSFASSGTGSNKGDSSAPYMLCSASDDSSVLTYDVRAKWSVARIPHPYQVTSVCMSSCGQLIYTGGIDNTIRQWDLRYISSNDSGNFEPSLVLTDNAMDTITGLALNAEGTHLLSNSMDSRLRAWDVRPFADASRSRCERVFEGLHHGAEKVLLRCAWSPNYSDSNNAEAGVTTLPPALVSCGSADRMVHIWDASNSRLMYTLPGHKGSVNEVIFHPKERIVASCGSDKQIYIGEL